MASAATRATPPALLHTASRRRPVRRRGSSSSSGGSIVTRCGVTANNSNENLKTKTKDNDTGGIAKAMAPSSFAPSCPPEAVTPDGWVAVLGIGSLLSERSARFTSPSLRNFKTVRLKGWRRVFAHTAPVFFQRGIASAETREISSLSMEPVVVPGVGGGGGGGGGGRVVTPMSEWLHGMDHAG
jgi:hypothetical protein